MTRVENIQTLGGSGQFFPYEFTHSKQAVILLQNLSGDKNNIDMSKKVYSHSSIKAECNQSHFQTGP